MDFVNAEIAPSREHLYHDENQRREQARLFEKLPEAIQQVLEKERKLLDFVRQPGFTSAKLRNRLFH